MYIVIGFLFLSFKLALSYQIIGNMSIQILPILQIFYIFCFWVMPRRETLLYNRYSLKPFQGLRQYTAVFYTVVLFPCFKSLYMALQRSLWLAVSVLCAYIVRCEVFRRTGCRFFLCSVLVKVSGAFYMACFPAVILFQALRLSVAVQGLYCVRGSPGVLASLRPGLRPS